MEKEEKKEEPKWKKIIRIVIIIGIVRNCSIVEHNWDYTWENWLPEESGMITAAFRLANFEDRSGMFRINFAFFDNSTYPYDEYDGINYDQVQDRLPWSAADMHVYNMSHNIGPRESVLFTPSVRKKNPSSVYWIYADVSVPEYRKCVTTYVQMMKNDSETIKRPVVKKIKKTVSLWQILVSFVTGREL